MENARYIRVSTSAQNEARQLAKLHADEKLFVDKISGTTPFLKREQASLLLKAVENGEIKNLSVSSIDRLGRNTIDVLTTIERLHNNNVTLKVDNLGLHSLVNGKENPTFKLIVSVLANIAEMERATLRERQLEGIAEAKKKGIYKGREKGTVETKDEVLSKYPEVVRYLKLNKALRDVASRSKVSLGTVQKVKKLISQPEG
jgi:DNA invertase Pin-like site-specific DNA recombinase